MLFLAEYSRDRQKSIEKGSIARFFRLTKSYDVHSVYGSSRPGRTLQSVHHKLCFEDKCQTSSTQENVPLLWNNECETEFISSDSILSLSNFKLPYVLNTDASHYRTEPVYATKETYKSLPTVNYKFLGIISTHLGGPYSTTLLQKRKPCQYGKLCTISAPFHTP